MKHTLGSYALLLTLLVAIGVVACGPAPTAMPSAPAAAPSQPTAVPASTKAPEPTKAPVSAPVLKLDGPNGTKSLTMEDLKALPASEGWAGIKSSTGKITVPERYKGVAVADLSKLVGTLGPDMGINLNAKDGYAMTISYDQITNSDFITYDPGTGDEIKIKDPLTVIIAYERGGKLLPEDSDGPLKLVVISAKNNQVVDGHWAVKWINQISVKLLAQEWKLPLSGAIAENMDRGTFQSCAASSCHGKTWTDSKAQVWSGVPLWLLAGRMDDEIRHGDGAYNDKLADQGYQVHVVSVDGTKITFDSAQTKRNSNILVAYLVNGNPLDDKDAPLKLVGSDLQPNEMVGRISKINLMLSATPSTAPPAATAPKPTDAPKPTVAASPAATTPGMAGLTINGAVDKEQKLTVDAIRGMGVVKLNLEHPKTGKQDYEGIRLNALLDLAVMKEGATKIVMSSSDGFTTEVALEDLKKCSDCLLAFSDGGKLNAAMPGMISSFWARDVVKIQVK